MTIWELHRDISNAIGDACLITQTSIPDGVRYSRELRDEYIYRASLMLLNIVMKASLSKDRKITSLNMEKLLPGMILEEFANVIIPTSPTDARYELALNPVNNVVYDIFYPVQLEIISVNVGETYTYPLPIKQGIFESALNNTRNVQKADPFCVLRMERQLALTNRNKIYIYDPNNILINQGNLSNLSVKIKYIPYPVNTKLFSDFTLPTFNPLQEYIFEDTLIPSIVTLSRMFALTDSQDSNSEDKMVMSQIQLELGGLNANS